MVTLNFCSDTCENFCLPKLGKYQKNKFLDYATQVLNAQKAIFDSCNNSILHYMLHEDTNFIKYKHYPTEERIDHNNGGQYFYHCHRENFITQEHGHFHCFLRSIALPKYLKSRLLIIENQPQKHPSAVVSMPQKNHIPMIHLVAIGLNQLGQPIRLFLANNLTNQEGTFSNNDIQNIIKRFKIEILDNSSWQQIDKWVEGIIKLFSPQISWLYQQRALQITKDISHLQNQSFSININLEQQIKWLISG